MPETNEALIGHTGFVGSNILAGGRYAGLYNSRNIGEIAGRHYDCVVCSGISAVKWMANKEPEQDWADIKRLLDCLEQVRADRFVLISTVDVYPSPNGQAESDIPPNDHPEAYGRHRRAVERFVEARFPVHHIVRLPGLFGPRLKKNVIFDMMHDNRVEMINPGGRFQWYPVARIAADIATIRARDLRLVNIAPEPVTTAEIAARFFPAAELAAAHAECAVLRHADRPCGAAGRAGASSFLQGHGAGRARPLHRRGRLSMRLAVSNLAWGADRQGAAFEMLAGMGVEGVEVAPTRIANWCDITPALLTQFGHDLAAAGLQTSSLQAVFYACPGAQLLGDAAAFEQMREQTRRVADIAAALGAGVAVFGAPRNRGRGAMAEADAFSLAATRLRELGELVQPAGLTLGMEPVPAHYGGDFLMRAADALRMVRAVDHPGVRLHLDSGCVLLGGDSIAEAIAEGAASLVHMHMAEPDLAGFSAPVADHDGASRALHAAGYDRWLSIEMREVPERALEEVATAVAFARRVYFSA